MKCIVIKNKGNIDVNSFKILGNSTKRQSDHMIGRFGSGLKYSIAKLLDLGIPFRVFSGLKEIKFGTKEITFRDQTFHLITINGEVTNFSTDMGPDWKEYDCIREIYSNAVDEGLIEFDTKEGEELEKDTTTFFIEITPAIEEIVQNFQRYFSFFRDDEFYDREGMRIYPSNGHLIIYKSGFMVYEDVNKKSLFHYDYADARINESRTLVSHYNTMNSICEIMLSKPNKELIHRFKRASHKTTYKDEYFEFKHDWWTFTSASSMWGEEFKGATLVTTDSQKFYEDHVRTVNDAYILPERMANEIKRSNPEKDTRVLGGSESDKATNYLKAPEIPERNKKLGRAMDYLADAGLSIVYEVEVAKFENEGIMGTVDEGERKIIISDSLLAKHSYIDVAEVIFEEWAHLESGFPDKSREFQNYLIKQCLKFMGLFSNLKSQMKSTTNEEVRDSGKN